jgi:hypothetical protein
MAIESVPYIKTKDKFLNTYRPMKLNKDDRREEMAAIGTMVLLTVILISITLMTIFELWK